jgi:uncharacterized protein (DUF3820 family)
MNHSTRQAPTQQQDSEQTPSGAPLMPFGVHRNKPLTEIPSDYLLWVGCLHDLRQPLLGHVLKEMGRRIMELEQQPEKREAVHG